MSNGPVNGLALVQGEFCLMKLDGQIRIMDLKQINDIVSGKGFGDVDYYKKPDGEILIKRFLETQTIPTSAIKLIVQNFWLDPKTKLFNAVAFSPLPLPATALNYWTGATAIPKAGDWSFIREFLQTVICDGEAETFQYLILFLAHMLQKPEEKPGIMIVFLGKQGTGKGTFFNLLRAIWNRTFLLVSDVDQVIGHFNAALERHYVVCMDEALFAGDKKTLERLKSTITEPLVRVEQKYQPSRTIDSYHRFFAASNNSHFAHIAQDDRRFLFLRVSESRQGDSAFFLKLFAAINDVSVVGAMVHDLLQFDLTSFNVRQRPKTKEHLNQKLQSLEGFDRFWYELLLTGEFNDWSFGIKTWTTPVFLSTKRLIDCYKSFDKSSERYRSIQSQQVATLLERLCPSAKRNRQQQERGYDFPFIDEARREFDVFIGGKINWDWTTPVPTESGPIVSEFELREMREIYEMDDSSIGPEDECLV